MSRFTDVSTLPPRYQAQVAAQAATTAKRPTEAATPEARATIAAEGEIMLRQSSDGLNKTEALFLAHLRASYPGAFVEAHPITLKLANGCRYTPDFVAFVGGQLVAYEVKGFMRDDAAVKVKVAASKFPFIRFVLVWRKRGEWMQQEVRP